MKFQKEEKNETLKTSQEFDEESIFHRNQINNINEGTTRGYYNLNSKKNFELSHPSIKLNIKEDLLFEPDKLEDGELIEKPQRKFKVNNEKIDEYNSSKNLLDPLDEININKIHNYEFIDNKSKSLNDLEKKCEIKNNNFFLTADDLQFLKELTSIENCFKNKHFNTNKSEKEIYDSSQKSKYAQDKSDNKYFYHSENKNNSKNNFEKNTSIVKNDIYIKENYNFNYTKKNNIRDKEHESNEIVNHKIIKYHSNENSYGKNRTIEIIDKANSENNKCYKKMELNLMEKQKYIYDSSGISNNYDNLTLPLDEYCEIGINKKLSIENNYDKNEIKNILNENIDVCNKNYTGKIENMDNTIRKINSHNGQFYRNELSINIKDSSQSALLHKKTLRNYGDDQL